MICHPKITNGKVRAVRSCLIVLLTPRFLKPARFVVVRENVEIENLLTLYIAENENIERKQFHRSSHLLISVDNIIHYLIMNFTLTNIVAISMGTIIDDPQSPS